MRRRHAEHYLGLAEEAEPHVRRPEAVQRLDRLEREHDNLRAALAWAKSVSGSFELGLRLAGALSWVWHIRDHPHDGLRWVETALARVGVAPALARARAIPGAGWLAHPLGDLHRAAGLFAEGTTLYRAAADPHGLAVALGYHGAMLDQRSTSTESAGHSTTRARKAAPWRERARHGAPVGEPGHPPLA